jgi:hypothetical protein
MALSETNQQLLVERLEALPKELANLITGGEFDYFLESLVEEKNFSEDQRAIISNELLLMFLLLEPYENLVDNLAVEAKLARIDAELIVRKLSHGNLAPLLVFVREVTEEATPEAPLSEAGKRIQTKRDTIVSNLVQKYTISQERVDDLYQVLDLVISGTNKTEDLVRLLKSKVNFDDATAQKVAAELTELMEPVKEREVGEVEAKKAEMASLAEKIKTIAPSTPAESTKSHETIAPIRTMQSDARVHGYGAELEKQQPQPEEEQVVKATPQADIQKPTTQ